MESVGENVWGHSTTDNGHAPAALPKSHTHTNVAIRAWPTECMSSSRAPSRADSTVATIRSANRGRALGGVAGGVHTGTRSRHGCQAVPQSARAKS